MEIVGRWVFCLFVFFKVSIRFAVMSLFRSDQKKTKVKKKTSNPHFEETFFFEVTFTTAHFAV